MLNIMERLTTMAFFIVAGSLAVLVFFALLAASNALGLLTLTAFKAGG